MRINSILQFVFNFKFLSFALLQKDPSNMEKIVIKPMKNEPCDSNEHVRLLSITGENG